MRSQQDSRQRPRTPVRKPNIVGDGMVAALSIGLGLVLPLVRGASVGGVVAAFVAGLVVPPLAVLLPARSRPIVLGVAFVAGIVVLQHGPLAAWLMSFLLGLVVLLHLLYRRQVAGRPRTSPAAPQVLWDEDGTDREVGRIDQETVLAAVRALDGRTRTYVSVLRDGTRLDVGGDAGGAMVLFCSDDRRHWHQLRTPGDRLEETPVRVAGQDGRYPTRETTDLASALTAVTTWLRDGTRDPGLAWHAATRHDDVVRPAALEATD